MIASVFKVTNYDFENYFSVYILILVVFSHLDLIQYINETNKSVEHLADVLSEKTRSSSWVVVFKALVTVHHLMVHGNEVSTVGMGVVVIYNCRNVLGLTKAYHILLSIVTNKRSEEQWVLKTDFFILYMNISL